MLSCKAVFVENLHKMPPGGVFFEVGEDQGVELVFKGHFQIPIASGYEGRNLFKCFSQGFGQMVNGWRFSCLVPWFGGVGHVRKYLLISSIYEKTALAG